MNRGHLTIIITALITLMTINVMAQQETEDPDKLRKKAAKLQKDGNHKEALGIYQTLLGNEHSSNVKLSGNDLNGATSCLQELKRIAEIDELIENALVKQPNNPSLLDRAGTLYKGLPHYGFIVAGKFRRGSHRSGGQYAEHTERDRIRAIQLYLQALQHWPVDGEDTDKAGLYSRLASAISIARHGNSAWRLQTLSDLTKLPRHEPGNRWHRGGHNPKGAPVDTTGKPLYYNTPATWEAAKNDGERWLFALARSTKLNPDLVDVIRSNWADFLHSQFGVKTMANYGWFRSIDMDDQKGILQLHTLEDNETVAKLANGVKRFPMPDEHNFIAIYKELAERNDQAADKLIRIYLDRRQYVKASTLLEATIDRFPNSRIKSRKKLLSQITGDWGGFGQTSNSSPAGTEPDLLYTYRNATSVTLVAHEVDITSMVDDLWEFIEGNPTKLDYDLTNFNGLGHALVNSARKKYVGKEVGRRTHTLKPRAGHWDTNSTLSVPVSKQGIYLVTAELENGTTNHTVVWIDAISLVKKQVHGGELFYVADAVTGKPVASAKVEFFGYDTVRREKPGLLKKHDFISKRLTKTTDKDGTLFIKNDELSNKYRWMIRASTRKGTTLLGFNRIHSYPHRDQGLSGHKSFGITDRPVYQPEQKVYGKFWIREARYDLGDVSTFAGETFTINITDATGTEVLKNFQARADAYGGIEYSYDLPEDAKLGSYSVQLRKGGDWFGNHRFRVEEYKKPEYEVSVDAPKEPVSLGDTFKATIKASYYHGAPVANAKVKVKVLRHRHNDLWFPYGPWNWLYGGGYGWLDVERPWYPGWSRWGCFSPRPFWWHRGGEQPEIVLEQELDIKPDGTVDIEVDTSLAKAVHSDTDHRYEVTAEVVDASRRTIVGKGSIVAARKPYNVTIWLDRGYANVGDPINATIAARTALGKEVVTRGKVILYRVNTDKEGKVIEKEVQSWDISTTNEINGQLKFQAGAAGQYRLAARMIDGKDREIEGAILFTVRGEGVAEGGFQYSDIELIPDKRTYANGSVVKLLINTRRPNSTVLLSLRGGMEYRFVHIKGQSKVVDIPVSLKDMPNFFIEAATVSNAKVHTAVREIIVPPEKRILNVEVIPSGDRFKPRAKGTVKVRITDQHGEAVQGSLALTIYDKSLEYISGGSNVADIKTHFWKWRRHFRGGFTHSHNHPEYNIVQRGNTGMQTLGAFGHSLADMNNAPFGDLRMKGGRAMRMEIAADSAIAPSSAMALESDAFGDDDDFGNGWGDGGANADPVMIRKDFADLIKWIGSVETDENGIAEVPVTFPDNLTTWKIKTWAMAHGTRVGEGSAEVITSKDLIIRLQAPRFFVEKDEVVLSAIVHNYLKTDQTATISLELEGGTLTSTSPLSVKRTIKAGGETRIDWRIKVSREGEAIVRMKVITEDDSDAMEMTYPVYVHGILKQEAWSRVIDPERNNTTIIVNVPNERRPEQTRLEIRYSPTIAGSIVDAIPHLVEYPYGCTEQTLNRFVPTVIAQKLIKEMGIDLEDVRNKRTNLNPQEIGDDKTRMAQWQRWQRNPVFNEKEVNKMTTAGIKKLREMQLSDGGWGWFSGYGERSYPHTTAVVMHGLLIAQANGAKMDAGMIGLGINWLKNHEAKETERIRNWKDGQKRENNTKRHATAMDAFVRLVLAEAQHPNPEMLGYLFRDKNQLSVYAKAMTGMTCHLAKDNEKRDALIRNIEQFLVYDEENQSAHLKLGNGSYWWYWYGSEIEAHAWYLKLLAATKPQSKQARGIVKYLINNRKHATYWNSTRDTAYCIEAIADYMRASGENSPEAEVTVSVDGKEIKTVKITKDNLFSYDNKVVLAGDALGSGEHEIEITRKGKDALYTNAYLTVFTKEDFIKKAGLEVKVERAYYKLERINDANEKTAGTNGQVIDHKVEKYKRIPLESGDMLTSGDLVEVELHIHSKNDYEYLMFNDWKPAGLEAIDVRSGYTSAHQSGMNAYMEMHHEKTSFFVRQLARGSHSVKYRLRAEIPGSFSALPTMAEAMYAPELKANSNEIKIRVQDKE